MMKIKKKTVIAAVLAAVMGLTGCNVSDKPANSAPYNYDYDSTQESTVSETPSSAASSSAAASSEPDVSSSAAASSESDVSSSTTASSESTAPESGGDLSILMSDLSHYVCVSLHKSGWTYDGDYIVAPSREEYDSAVETYLANNEKYARSSSSECKHKDLDEEVLEPATCKQHGRSRFTCKKCGYSYEKETYGEHNYVEGIDVEPTKDNVGTYEEKCTLCGQNYIDTRYVNYFNDYIYWSRELAEADLAAMKLVENLGLNSGSKSDLQKLCVLKKWFCDNTSYDGTYENHSPYDILVGNSGVCESYAEALYLILPKCGIDTYYCSSSESNHAWNLVNIDGQWTYTDFTGGIGFNSEEVVLGTSCHGVPDPIKVSTLDLEDVLGDFRKESVSFDMSKIDTTLHVYDLNGNELESQMESDGFSYVDGNGQGWKYIF